MTRRIVKGLSLFIIMILASNLMTAQQGKKMRKSNNKMKKTVSTHKTGKSMEKKKQSLFYAGIISKPEATVYMYGTHSLKGKVLNGSPEEPEKLYALKSDKYNLDKFMDKKVVIMASKIEGYPVDFGPDYLDVDLIEEDKTISIDSPPRIK